MRCALRTIGHCCVVRQDSRWRQWQYNTRQVKRVFRQAQKLRPSTAKDPKQKAIRQQAIREAHEAYLALCTHYLSRIEQTQKEWAAADQAVTIEAGDLSRWIAYGWKQIDLIRRRVLEGETIPHQDKVFSLFEDYTQWLSKGKAGVPVELGLNVCIVEANTGFILHYNVMQQCTDSEIAVDIIRETKAQFPQLASCSFDKGFHSQSNQTELAELLDQVFLPRKGKLSAIHKAAQNDPEFVQARRQHSAVESGINALEVHGLDRCPDRGLDHFKRYVALAVVGRNLQKLGAILQADALKQQQRRERRRRAA